MAAIANLRAADEAATLKNTILVFFIQPSLGRTRNPYRSCRPTPVSIGGQRRMPDSIEVRQ
jgi:hypothetical protein